MKTVIIPDMTQILIAYQAVEDKLAEYPGHIFYSYAQRKISEINKPDYPIRIDKILNTTRDIGIMCVRELEVEDLDTCMKIYNMNSYLRSITGLSEDDIFMYQQGLIQIK